MQDNFNQHTNYEKSFVNESWQKLRTQLDEDIPVEKKETKSLVYLLSLLLITSLSFSSYLLYLQNQEIPVTELIKEKIIFKEVFIDKEKSEKNNSIHKNIIPDNNSDIIQNRFSKIDLGIDQNFKNETLDISTIKNEIGDQDFKNLDKLLLSSIDLFPTDRPIHNIEIKNQELSVEKNKSKLKYNLGMSKMIANDLDYSGYGFTTGVEFPISKKIGISTGLAINFISRDFLIFPIFDRQKAYSSKSFNDPQDQRTYYDGLESFKQIYLPISVNYNVNEIVSINSGLKLRYTYDEQVNSNVRSLAASNITKPESFENTFFNNTNFGLSAGLSFNVTRKLNLMLESEWGLGSLINKKPFRSTGNETYDLNIVNLTTSFTF